MVQTLLHYSSINSHSSVSMYSENALNSFSYALFLLPLLVCSHCLPSIHLNISLISDYLPFEFVFSIVSFELILLSQVDLVHEEVSVSDTVCEKRYRRLQNQSGSKESGSIFELVDQSQDTSLFGTLDPGRIFNKVTPLYQRILSALIVEDDIEEYEEIDAGRNVLLQNATGDSPLNAHLLIDTEPKRRDGLEFECEMMFGVQTQDHGTGSRLVSCNGNITFGRSTSIQNPPCNNDLLVGDSVSMHSHVEVLAKLSRNDLEGPQSIGKNGFGFCSVDCQFEKMCLDDKLLLELQSIGLYPEAVPDLDDREDEVLNQEIVQLKRGLYEQIGKKKMCLGKIYEIIQGGKEVAGRDLEQIAMDRMVELAYKKLLATRGGSAAKSRVAKVSKQVALVFVKRTLARCRQFEDSGTSCFIEPALRDIIFAAPLRCNELEATTCAGLEGSNCSFVSSADGGPLSAVEVLSDQAFAKKGPISNRGKKKEVFIDDVVGNAALRTSSTLGTSPLCGTKGKRSERERDKDTSTRNALPKSGCSSMCSFKGERKMKTKTKPKQKTAQLSTSGNGFSSPFTETTHPVCTSASGSTELVNSSGNRKREVGFMSPGNIPQDSSMDNREPMGFANLELHRLDPMEELNVGADVDGNQDLCSWLNFDEDGLQDHDSMGLEIPMDDLSELNMF
ncbi:unnamed protein product [Ilex paraguariensis]|uniref:Uncharacterized protein n=1 Tax=Ilex paraguariensis TaxID=185542 RepID=A0ABC8TP83_9AQUA